MKKLPKAEKLTLVGGLMIFVSVAAIDANNWHIGLTFGLIGLLIMTRGFDLINQRENEKKYREIIRRKKYETTEKAKSIGKEITFQTWLDTRRVGGTFLG